MVCLRFTTRCVTFRSERLRGTDAFFCADKLGEMLPVWQFEDNNIASTYQVPESIMAKDINNFMAEIKKYNLVSLVIRHYGTKLPLSGWPVRIAQFIYISEIGVKWELSSCTLCDIKYIYKKANNAVSLLCISFINIKLLQKKRQFLLPPELFVPKCIAVIMLFYYFWYNSPL